MTEQNRVNCEEFTRAMNSKSPPNLQTEATNGLDLTEHKIHIKTLREVNVFVFELGNGVNWEVPLRQSTQIRDEETNKYYITGWNFDIFADQGSPE